MTKVIKVISWCLRVKYFLSSDLPEKWSEEGAVSYGGLSKYRTSNSGKLQSTRSITVTSTSTLNTHLTQTKSGSKQIPFGFTTSAK
jgi:hypothetical protein